LSRPNTAPKQSASTKSINDNLSQSRLSEISGDNRVGCDETEIVFDVFEDYDFNDFRGEFLDRRQMMGRDQCLELLAETNRSNDLND
jgi:hypothetical protein